MSAPDAASALADAYARETRLARALAVPPRATQALAGALVLVFVGMHLAAASLRSGGFAQADYRTVLVFGEANRQLILSGDWWRPVAALFLHVTPAHVALNIGALLVFMPLAERCVGRWRTVCVFGISGACGALASAWLQDGSSVGASPGIAGLLGAIAVVGFRYREQLPRRLSRALVGASLAFSVVGGLAGALDPAVDSASHIAGWLLGVVLGCVVPATAVDPRPERASRVVGLALTGAAVFSVAMMVSEGSRCGGDPARFDACYASVFAGVTTAE